MSISFSRTIDNLRGQRFNHSFILIVMILSLLWGIWFVKASIPLYQEAEVVEIINSNRAVAQFPPAALLNLQPGQLAWIHLSGFSQSGEGVIAAQIRQINNSVRNGYIQVDLQILQNQESVIPLQSGLTGMVEVEVERISPMALVLRSVGQ